MTEANSSLIIEQVFPPRGLVGPSEGMQKVARLLRSKAYTNNSTKARQSEATPANSNNMKGPSERKVHIGYLS